MRLLLSVLLLFVFVVLSSAQTLTPTPTPHSALGPTYPGPRLSNACSNPYNPPPMQRIPGGEYEMGDHLGTGHYDELPVHAVYIDAFDMDTFEVTNEEYRTFLNSAIHQGLIEVLGGAMVYKKNGTEVYCVTTNVSPYSRIIWNGCSFSVTAGKEAHPMVEVTWYGAAAYANWRGVQEGLTPCYDLETWECNYSGGGYRLPTEAEWEKASRGGEHSPYAEYPWGSIIDGSMANYWYSGDPYELGNYPYSTPVGYYDGNQIPTGVDMANGYGLYDMAGNVWEWCNDWYDDSYYQYCVDHGIYFNPKGPSSATLRVHRGGSSLYVEGHLRCASRSQLYPGNRFPDLGFRLVQD